MHNGLKFQGSDGKVRSVSASNPLPVAGGSGGGAGGLTNAELTAVTGTVASAAVTNPAVNTAPSP